MNKYEIMFIVRPDMEEAEIKKTAENMKKVLTGAGGQNVNKVESGVRVNYMYTDPDTGETEKIQVANTETRDQPKNNISNVGIGGVIKC